MVLLVEWIYKGHIVSSCESLIVESVWLSQQTWSGFSSTTVPDNNRQSRLSPMTVPEMSTGTQSFRMCLTLNVIALRSRREGYMVKDYSGLGLGPGT